MFSTCLQRQEAMEAQRPTVSPVYEAGNSFDPRTQHPTDTGRPDVIPIDSEVYAG